jgi:hypothetical protein
MDAAAVTATLCLEFGPMAIPDPPQPDTRGLHMEMVSFAPLLVDLRSL